METRILGYTVLLTVATSLLKPTKGSKSLPLSEQITFYGENMNLITKKKEKMESIVF